MKPILNKKEKRVLSNGRESHLTPKEYGILEFLMEHPNQTFTAEEIYENAWDEEPFDCHLIISVHMRHIRGKIEKDPSRPELIKAFWGRGYQFVC